MKTISNVLEDNCMNTSDGVFFPFIFVKEGTCDESVCVSVCVRVFAFVQHTKSFNKEGGGGTHSPQSQWSLCFW